MSYFLIYRTEDGIKIKQFRNNGQLEEYLADMFCDESIKFMDYIPAASDELNYGEMIAIKGEVVIPEPITIVKTYKVR